MFYVFYEQYLTMWSDVLRALGISIATIFLVSFFLMGLDFHSAFILLIMIVTIITNLAGMMYWWNISLNAVSLVNLVMVRILAARAQHIDERTDSLMMQRHHFVTLVGRYMTKESRCPKTLNHQLGL